MFINLYLVFVSIGNTPMGWGGGWTTSREWPQNFAATVALQQHYLESGPHLHRQPNHISIVTNLVYCYVRRECLTDIVSVYTNSIEIIQNKSWKQGWWTHQTGLTFRKYSHNSQAFTQWKVCKSYWCFFFFIYIL